MPQPDLVLLRERDDFYASQRAGPQDILLLIEVSDSSADYDRNVKLPRYAEAGIPEVWITVIPEGIVEAHTEPAGGRYTQMRTFCPGDTISPQLPSPTSPCQWTRSCPGVTGRTKAMTTQAKSPPAIVRCSSNSLLRRFTVDEYFAMAEAGILKKEERVDLLDGLIVDPKPVLNSRFYSTVTKLNTFLIRALGRRAISSVRATVALDEYNAPESELTLLQEREDFYASKIPDPADALLVIEVSDSTMDADYDRNEKLPRLRPRGIPEVWLTICPSESSKPTPNPPAGDMPRCAPSAPAKPSPPAPSPISSLPSAIFCPNSRPGAASSIITPPPSQASTVSRLPQSIAMPSSGSSPAAKIGVTRFWPCHDTSAAKTSTCSAASLASITSHVPQ